MTEQQAVIVEGPYLFFIGADNSKTYGIKVRSLLPLRSSKREEWEINEHSLKTDSRYKDFLGLSNESYSELLSKFNKA